MTLLTLKPKSLATKALCAMMLGMSLVALPNLASAADHAAPIRPAVPAQSAASPNSSSADSSAQSGSGGAALSNSGSPVMSGAWCDPITHVCERHPWTSNNS